MSYFVQIQSKALLVISNVGDVVLVCAKHFYPVDTFASFFAPDHLNYWTLLEYYSFL